MHGRSLFGAMVLAAGVWLWLSAGLDGSGHGLRAGEAVMEMDTLVYHFGDSSVPPPYHRSYTITLDATKAELVVDSYGDLVHRDSQPFPTARWGEVMNWVKEADPRHCERPAAQGCTGGTSESLRLLRGGQVVFEGWVYHCQGDSGNLCADLKGLSQRLRGLFGYFSRSE